MLVRIVLSFLILIVTVENISSKDLSVPIGNSTSYLRQERVLLPADPLGKLFKIHNINKRNLNYRPPI